MNLNQITDNANAISTNKNALSNVSTLITTTQHQLTAAWSRLNATIAVLGHVETGMISCARDDLRTGSGIRSYSTSHTFTRPFTTPPTMHWAVSGAEGWGDGVDNDFNAYIYDVTGAGFKLTCYTFNRSKLSLLYVRWIAFPKVE